MGSNLFFLSVPGLRPQDLDRANTPTLFAWANSGSLAELTPTFPCVTSCVQASMLTGVPPAQHGIIANGFYYPDRPAVEMWTGWNTLIEAPQIWERLRARGITSAVWHAQNIKGADADFVVTPAPIHEPDGTTKLWCYSKPDGLYQQLLTDLGHFPLQHYWGPLSNIESTRWILRGAAWLFERRRPAFNWIYVPHLDYAMQKFGPNSPQARAALSELDGELAIFERRIGDIAREKASFLVAGEYAMTDVTGVVFPNRVLRQAGLLEVKAINDREHLDLVSSRAFALVDHQFAHLFFKNKSDVPQAAALFQKSPGIAGVFAGHQRAEIGLDHSRSGDIVLVCEDSHWLAYYWWLDEARAPAFAQTVDIHQKPGYDPVELFFDPKTRGIPLNASLVRGSHGVPASGPHHRTAMISSVPIPKGSVRKELRDTDLCALVQESLT